MVDVERKLSAGEMVPDWDRDRAIPDCILFVDGFESGGRMDCFCAGTAAGRGRPAIVVEGDRFMSSEALLLNGVSRVRS